MALIDRDEFERGKLEAAAYWKRRGDGEAARRFAALEIGTCGFGMDATARLAWGRATGLTVGLRFHLETGKFVNSFVHRAPKPD